MNDQIIVDAFLFVPVHAREVVMTISDADESADGGEYTHLFQADKNLTSCPTLQRIVGRHVEVFGSGFDRIVRIGTTVRVDQNRCVWSRGRPSAGSAGDESDDDESDDSVTERSNRGMAQ